MPITRRAALRTIAAAGATAGATAVLPRRVWAREPKVAAPGAVAVLYDSTRCIGCEECVRGCAGANGCDEAVATAEEARLTPRSLTVLRSYDAAGHKAFRKVQCMHCVDPACVSACMLGAMRKNEDGSVTWNGDLCVGCRYCEIACPFNVPRFEWDTPAPELTKCELCPERRARGLAPACVERCRMGALVYGTREGMLAEARRRIAESPDRYNPDVYGDQEGGGTSVLYLAKAGVSFADMGLPSLGSRSVPSLPETIQHTLYRGFVAPLALFAVLGAVVRRNTKKLAREEAEHHGGHEASEAVGGKLLTWPFLTLAALALVGVLAIGWRFVEGLGAVTNLNDGYPMGLWIAFDVVTGTALACGGYAVALLVYLANRGKYHPLVRAAIVTSALGYTLGGLSVLIDIGRAWNFYKIPLYFWEWNVNSILLEVALCIMLYTMVLWIEISPAFLEKWQRSSWPRLRRFAVKATPKLNRAMPYVIALGMLLPTMHQSSLGSLMLLAGPKLHPLWHTPLLPLLFLISVIGMGYAAVSLECCLSAKAFRRPQETPMLRALARPVAVVILFYAAVRMVEIVSAGELGLLLAVDRYTVLFLAEMALFVGPAIGLLLHRQEAGPRFFMLMAVAIILAGALYRFSTYLIAFNPGPEWSYFPSLGEFAVTIGLVSAEIAGYVVLVKKFPILRGVPREEAETGPAEPVRDPGDIALPTLPGARAATAGVLALVALGALLALASPAGAQDSSRVGGDLRCLTSSLCLEEPVSPSEPHGAICATCHDFDAQARPAEAVATCGSGGCHEAPERLTRFHRGLDDAALRDCVRCHDPHDAPISRDGATCTACHTGGVRYDEPRSYERKPLAGRPVAVDVTFRHGQHTGTSCDACHGSETVHATMRVTRLADCRSCHHNQPVASTCVGCHDTGELALRADGVERRLDIRVGGLDRPLRRLPFAHQDHERFQCQTCHTGGLALSAAATDCSACHELHHQPASTCVACHAAPAPGAHDRNAHLGCAGSGCHEAAPASLVPVPRTRSVCLACHQDRQDHEPGSTCSTCHLLPPPRPADP